MKFSCTSFSGTIVKVEARGEDQARDLAMRALYGETPSPVTPDAPPYQGLGLIVRPAGIE